MKKVRIIIIIVFIGFFVLISGASLIIKDREFSPNENRYLAETPELSWDNILSGKFQDGLEDYLRDQVCFRDGWITVKTGIQKACGDTDIVVHTLEKMVMTLRRSRRRMWMKSRLTGISKQLKTIL